MLRMLRMLLLPTTQAASTGAMARPPGRSATLRGARSGGRAAPGPSSRGEAGHASRSQGVNSPTAISAIFRYLEIFLQKSFRCLKDTKNKFADTSFARASERRLLLTVAFCHHIFSSSHLHIFSSSHLLIFSSSHLLIFSSSHPLVFTSSHLHIFSSSHLLFFTSSHLHIFSSSHLLIWTSSHFTLLPSCPLAFFSLFLFYFSLKAGGSAN